MLSPVESLWSLHQRHPGHSVGDTVVSLGEIPWCLCNADCPLNGRMVPQGDGELHLLLVAAQRSLSSKMQTLLVVGEDCWPICQPEHPREVPRITGTPYFSLNSPLNQFF